MTVTPRPLLYLAGPYTHPDPVENTHRACRVATAIYEHTNWVPFLPHTTMLWHLVTPRPVKFWYGLDVHHLAACQAIMRLPGESTGADAEMSRAAEFDLAVVEFESLSWKVQQHWVVVPSVDDVDDHDGGPGMTSAQLRARYVREGRIPGMGAT
jgi:hypothetical protein